MGSAFFFGAFAASCGSEQAGCATVTCAAQAEEQAQSAGRGGSGGSSGGGVFGAVDSEEPSGLTDEQVCTGQSLEAQAAPVNVLILFDRSVSMLEPANPQDPNSPTRWDAMTAAIQTFVQDDRVAGTHMGLQFFGLSNGNDDCSSEKYATPAVPIGPVEEVRSAILAALAETQPGSLTPTEPALTGALQYAQSIAGLPENQERATVVAFVSDGQPSECPLGPNGESMVSLGRIVELIESYATPPAGLPPVKTYVVGTEELAANAERFALAGGAQAFLVGARDVEAELLQSMLSIVTKPLTCEVPVPTESPVPGETLDLDRIRVRFTPAASSAVREFPRMRGAGNCTLGDGWFYDDEVNPTRIVFCTQTCAQLGAGQLQVEFGCEPQSFVR